MANKQNTPKGEGMLFEQGDPGDNPFEPLDRRDRLSRQRDNQPEESSIQPDERAGDRLDGLMERYYALNTHLKEQDRQAVFRLACLAYFAEQLGNTLLGFDEPPLSSGKVSPLLDDFVRLATLALRYEEVLGITPQARGKIGGQQPDSFTAMMKGGQE